MTEEIITKLFRQAGLGTVIPPISPVSGGFLHRMYRVNTEERSFAVKHLNPEIMQRPAAAENFRRAEELEARLEAAGLPIVAAMTVNRRKLQTLDGAYFYTRRSSDCCGNASGNSTAISRCVIASQKQRVPLTAEPRINGAPPLML